MTARPIVLVGNTIAVAVVLAILWFPSPTHGQGPGRGRWITAWTTSQQALGDARITNATVRVIARATIPGNAVRIRLDNTFGTEPVTIGRAFVGLRVRGALLAAGSNRPLTFDGKPEVVVPPGGTVSSDAVMLTVLARQDLAVSLYVPGENVRPSQHTNAVVTSYRTADGTGDVGSDESSTPFQMTTTSFWWLKAIDVQSEASSGAIVAFGDSITDGTCSTLDAHDRWEDVMSLRLALERNDERARGRRMQDGPKAVLNEGIGGNTITREGLNPPADTAPALERIDRDALSHHGVTHVVLFEGTNDIRRGATAASLIQAITAITQRVRAKGIGIIGATIIPRHNTPPAANTVGWDSEKTRIRNEVNQWIRTKAPFDDVIDFDEAVRDPASPDLILTPFNCGDGIHPSALGYYQMGRSINLAIFSRR